MLVIGIYQNTHKPVDRFYTWSYLDEKGLIDLAKKKKMKRRSI